MEKSQAPIERAGEGGGGRGSITQVLEDANNSSWVLSLNIETSLMKIHHQDEEVGTHFVSCVLKCQKQIFFMEISRLFPR